ncbi:MAG: hypothetical protein ACPKPY_00965 [Nitrososphaeraceae archaeon]
MDRKVSRGMGRRAIGVQVTYMCLKELGVQATHIPTTIHSLTHSICWTHIKTFIAYRNILS